MAQNVAAMGLGPLDELTEYLKRQSLWYLANVDRANIFFTEARNLTGDRHAVTEQRAAGFAKHVRDLIAAAQAQGQIRCQVDPRMLTRYVLGSLNNIRFWPSRSGSKFSTEQMLDALIRMTLNALEAQEPANS